MLKSDKKTGTVHEDTCTFMKVSCWTLLRMRNVRDTSCIEKENTHFFPKTILKKNCVIYEIMWKTKEELRGHTWQYGTVHVPCMLITKATDAHSEYVQLTAFPLPVDGSIATIWNTVLCYNQKYMLPQKHTFRLMLLHSVIKYLTDDKDAFHLQMANRFLAIVTTNPITWPLSNILHFT